MNLERRLYRLTPVGGKPNHYTDSYASALRTLNGDEVPERLLKALQPGDTLSTSYWSLERVA